MAYGLPGDPRTNGSGLANNQGLKILVLARTVECGNITPARSPFVVLLIWIESTATAIVPDRIAIRPSATVIVGVIAGAFSQDR